MAATGSSDGIVIMPRTRLVMPAQAGIPIEAVVPGKTPVSGLRGNVFGISR